MVEGLMGNVDSQSMHAIHANAKLAEAGISRRREPLRKLASACLEAYVDKHRQTRAEYMARTGLTFDQVVHHPETLPDSIMPVMTLDLKRRKTLEKQWFADRFLHYSGPLSQSALSATKAYQLLLALCKHDPDHINIPCDEYLTGSGTGCGETSE